MVRLSRNQTVAHTPRPPAATVTQFGTIDDAEALRLLRVYVNVRLAAARFHAMHRRRDSESMAIVQGALEKNVRSIAVSLRRDSELRGSLEAFADDMSKLWDEHPSFDTIAARHAQIDPHNAGQRREVNGAKPVRLWWE